MNAKLDDLITAGNKKLPRTTAIFNMGSASECPSKALGLCQAYDHSGKCVCYALKAEIQYPPVLPYRNRQKEYWQSVTAERFVAEFLTLNLFKRNKFTSLRLNEAGDFFGQGDIDKAERIAGMLKEYGITVYAYSARRDLDFSNCHSLIVMGSNFHKEGISGIFKMVEEESEGPVGFGKCAMDCKVCKRCLVGMNTYVLKH